MTEGVVKQETAESRMIKRVPTFSPNDPVSEVIEKISKESWDAIDWVYVVDANKTLKGGVPIQRLLTATQSQTLGQISHKIPVTVTPVTDQERVAIAAIENDLQQIPVVAEKGKLVGAVPSDQIIDILHDEHLEDLLKATGVESAGIGLARLVSQRITSLVGARAPWLLLGLVGGFVATQVVSLLEQSFLKEISLVFFIPVVVYMAAAIGTQTQTIYIRTITFAKVNFAKYLIREIVVAGLIGLISSAALYLFSIYWLANPQVSAITSLSLLISMITAPILAVSIPFFLNLLNKDPAIGSGPFTTIVQDIASLVIYYLVVIALI